jgi:hypothetical protein
VQHNLRSTSRRRKVEAAATQKCFEGSDEEQHERSKELAAMLEQLKKLAREGEGKKISRGVSKRQHGKLSS